MPITTGRLGRLRFSKLKDRLPRLSNPENVLVWHAGFTDWLRAGDVPEFRAQTSTPPPVPSDQAPTWQVKWWWYAVPFVSVGVGSHVGRKVMA
ncbi:GYF domain-containing protein [Bradyrhizobium sp. USDA 4011]